MGARGSTFLAGAVFDLRGAIEGAAVVSAEPSPATPQPPAFRTGPYPADAHLRTVLQVWHPIIFRRDCRAADALALRYAWLMQEPLGGSLCGHFYARLACGPGLFPKEYPAVRMAVWPSSVARGGHYALDSLNLPLN